MTPAPVWEPFRVDNAALVAPRPISTPEGVGDRLRTAAFAEVQAAAAFLWASETLADAPEDLRAAWRALAAEERKHRDWLVCRMDELGVRTDERPVRDTLWLSLTGCTTAHAFCLYMADAEERGRRAGHRFEEQLAAVDPATARIFGDIAREEIAHIELARRYGSPASRHAPD